MNRFRTTSLTVLLVLSLLATGSALTLAQDVVTVTWWTEQSDFLPAVQETFVKAFNEAHTDIQLEMVGQPNLNDLLRTAFSAGEAPDILQSPGASFIAEFTDAGLILPLTGYAEQWDWQNKLLPWAYESGVLDGELYSIPLTYESQIILYNKTLFEENGWEPPTTLDELNALAAEITATGKHVFSFGNADWRAFNELLLSVYLNNYAGPDNVYSALIGEKSWTDPEFAGAIELLRSQMADQGWYSGSLENYYSYGDADYYTELASGDAAMILTGSFAFQNMPTYFTEESGSDWDWAPIPMFSDDVGDYIYLLATGSTLSINGQSEHPEAAAEVLNFLVSNPALVLSTSANASFGEWMVPLQIEQSDFPEGTDPRIARFFADFADVTAQGRYGYTTWTFWPAKADVQLWEDVEQVWGGQLSIEEYLAAQQALWDEARTEGATLPVPQRN